MFEFNDVDSREAFDTEEYHAWLNSVETRFLEAEMERDHDFDNDGDWDECECDFDNDGQPSEYEEWQDVFGGDVEEYGSYGCYDEDGDFGYYDE